MYKVAAAVIMYTTYNHAIAMSGTIIPTETNAARGTTIHHSKQSAYIAVKQIIPRRDVDNRMHHVLIARSKGTSNQCVQGRGNVNNNNIEEAET